MTPRCNARDRAEMLIPPLPWNQPRWRQRKDGPPVVLLHGLWRGLHAMEPLARDLDRNGFSTLNIPYSSTRRSIPDLVTHIAETVNRTIQEPTVHFVTHSLGGILVRALMAEPLPWRVGRVVMLVPPNQGSEIVDWAKHNHPLLHRFLGPAGRTLGTNGLPCQLPPPPTDAEIAIIMGRRALIPWFQRILEPENDGIVSASSGRLADHCQFTVIDADHTFIPMHPDALRLTIGFLKSGCLASRDSRE